MAEGLPTLLTAGQGCLAPAGPSSCQGLHRVQQSLWLDDWRAQLLCVLHRLEDLATRESKVPSLRPGTPWASGVEASLNVPRLLLEGRSAHFLVCPLPGCSMAPVDPCQRCRRLCVGNLC